MVEIKQICTQCNEIGIITIQQSVISWELLWYESFYCSFCSSAFEADGKGFPPEDIRYFITEDEGRWQLIVNSVELTNKVKTLKILRKILNLSMKKMSILQNTFPNLVSGTKTEMKWLKLLLLNEGIESLVKKVDYLNNNSIITIIPDRQ